MDVSAWTTRWCRVLVLSVIAGMLIGGPPAEASPHSGCSVRAYADSCVDACCVWCPASNATTTTNITGLGMEMTAAAATSHGSCHDRSQAPCGAAGVSRPSWECYVELGVALGILAGVLASGAGLCYARRWWVRRRAARLGGAVVTSARSRERSVTMVDIPYAELEGGRLAYYASPYALAGNVEHALDDDGDKTDHARMGKCQTQ
ncbi:hypothetical protein pmac_cds_637 [Pandoravirus macleodensis]|uniref:Uncharacterized protein n=1 Tax=Pandoravirus macleodensis TaxID=2107707 RepID=A0A2U7UG12_9VIRU|nr:hypothetical protein pmac_cds_637 [Pandoravirus macleodensis]AVK77325.1 hypothetical protein pmac_cds_637 [Pandoravirus macleodensis]